MYISENSGFECRENYMTIEKELNMIYIKIRNTELAIRTKDKCKF